MGILVWKCEYVTWNFRSRSSSHSSSPGDGRVEFITEFGGDDEVGVATPSLDHTHQSTSHEAVPESARNENQTREKSRSSRRRDSHSHSPRNRGSHSHSPRRQDFRSHSPRRRSPRILIPVLPDAGVLIPVLPDAGVPIPVLPGAGVPIPVLPNAEVPITENLVPDPDHGNVGTGDLVPLAVEREREEGELYKECVRESVSLSLLQPQPK